MNGAHDLGGTMGFGEVVPEVDEPVFHSDWERRTMAVTLAGAMLGRWSLDESRHVRENRPPATYLTSTYYRIWLDALESLLLAHGLVDADELAGGRARHPGADGVPTVSPDTVARVLSRGAPTERATHGSPGFEVGQAVRARNIHPAGHTRLPRYVRGHRGTVELVHGVHVLPDTNAHGGGENPEWLYTVRFAGTELWGEAADASVEISVDAWESYLEPA
ncbi:nitrile hydratase subunit beta [Pseudonocardia sp. KRD291]|uniref:nitrile hydratase subunit beta n=1 Tax=Pseudonocardia sp. KRD291 TaxID=2792007 RepID=UPI001C4A15F1|nr:nitrile hydratase subunit beta [Pseudonocardia sp. KRD291]MBW0106011.1 nitrile hydratase subunit beta [Pseudonocardia sp. KRD291]